MWKLKQLTAKLNAVIDNAKCGNEAADRKFLENLDAALMAISNERDNFAEHLQADLDYVHRNDAEYQYYASEGLRSHSAAAQSMVNALVANGTDADYALADVVLAEIRHEGQA